VKRILRQSPALHPSPWADQEDILSLNLAVGCAHGCPFCSARAYPNYPGDEIVYLYNDTAERISQELADRAKRPRAVYVSPSTDPFPPLLEVQEETARVVSLLAGHGIEVWLMTRGFIRPAALEVLGAYRNQVKVTIGLTTLDRALQLTLEPLAASPQLRLRQIRRLRDMGIAVQVALEPLVPGLTDTRDNLAAVLQTLAAAGVRQVSAGYLFLRSRIQENLVRTLKPLGWDGLVVDAFQGGPILETGPVAAARYLPKARRQRGYATLMALGADLGITVRVNGITNPDFRPPRPPEAVAGPRQRLLPHFEETFQNMRRRDPEEMFSTPGG
jgi:DNA repair photolyase